MTPCELKLWRFIALTVNATTMAPNYPEMVRAMGLKSKSGIANLLGRLEHRGVIKILRFQTRGIELLQRPPAESGVLCSIEVAAGVSPSIWISPEAKHPAAFAAIRRALDHAESEINAVAASRLGERTV